MNDGMSMTLEDLLSENTAADITEADGAEAPTYNSTAETRAPQCSIGWNPWHGCTKISPGCLNCYVYRRDETFGISDRSGTCRKTSAFSLPRKRRRDGSLRIAPGSTVMTCFTSDFLLPDADEWRGECWDMMRERRDCRFVFFTKRIDRLDRCLPSDWEDGYENVTIGCTVENRQMAEYRLPIFLSQPLRHRIIVAEPLLESLDISRYLGGVDEVIVGGESGDGARCCDYAWVLDLRRQCIEHGTAFSYHQTGARLIKNGRIYNIPRAHQLSQAKRARIDWSAR